MADPLAASAPNGRRRLSDRVVPLILVLAASWSRVLDAQGVTGAALQGRVLRPDSSGIEDAAVMVTNTVNGERWRTVSHAKGRYSLEQLSIGGPYVVEVRAVGYAPARREGVYLSLGQRLAADFTLSPLAYELSGITVAAEPDPLINAGRTGPSYSVPESTAARVPVFDRDFLRLALLSPRVSRTRSGGLSIAGQPDRLNAIQIDGATNQDMLGSSGIAGIQVLGARTLSIESIQELQVIPAPFDVRYGNFAAGLVNAVTKSGTNRWEGSVSGYYADEALVGKDIFGARVGPFTDKELTVTLGGPILRDRAAVFLDASLQDQVVPEGARLLGKDPDDSVGVRTSDALRFQGILRDTYGVEAGSFGAHPNRLPGGNFLGKVSLQLGVNSRLELSRTQFWSHLSLQLDRDFDAYSLTSRAFDLPVQGHATRLSWTTVFGGRYSNELTLAHQQEGFRCEPAVDWPIVSVRTAPRYLTAGSSCMPAIIRSRDTQNQNLLELTDNFTIVAGSHRLTLGTHDERLRILDLPPLDYFFNTGWTFASLDSLEAGRPDEYQAILRNPRRASGPLSDPLVTLVEGYVQDQWNPIPRLTVTAGLRVDVPYISRRPEPNAELLDSLGIDNTLTPSGHPLWAPRLGLNFDLTGRGTTYLRGGVGWFAGRPAYKWLVAVDAHTGLEAYGLDCVGDAVPAFTLDPAHQPTSCAGEPFPQAGPINVFDPGFRFPRNRKLALGADQRLPGGLVGTVDFLYTRAVNQFALTDRNLRPAEEVASGEGDRLMYGTVGANGRGQPNRVNQRFGQVIAVGNARGDRSYSVTTQLQKRFANGTELGLSYTYSRSRDRLSSDADNTDVELNIGALDGSLEQRRLTTALWNVPHRVTLLATANLPLGFRGALFYEGRSGDPYTYGIFGDANADGFDGDDIMYVPRDPDLGGDIALAVFDESTGMFVPAPPAEYVALAEAITDADCLRTQRGRIMRRNSCRHPWSNNADARLSRVFSTFRGHSMELVLDIFNVLHLVNDEWGKIRGSETVLLELVGYDQARGRGVYQRIPAVHNGVDRYASRWRMQLGARYTF
jgi:Carboxypeptidase regulatory-like domain